MENISRFTHGKIYGPLISFTIPIFFSILLQVLYSTADLLIVGQFCSPSSVSAVSTGAQLVMTLIMIITNLCMGTSILVGQKIGAEKTNELSKIVGSSLYLFGMISIVLTFVVVVFARPFATIMQAPPEAVEETVAYIRISGYGIIGIIGYNILCSIFRGMGDSTTPLIAVAFSCILNVAGDLLLVGYFNMGASGAAWATITAQGLSIVFSLLLVKKKKKIFTQKISDIKYDKEICRNVLKLGIPLALQSGLVNISFLVITAITNHLGVIVSAGVGITERLAGFLLFVPMAFGQSIASYTSHNVGCKQFERAKKAMLYGIITSLSLGVFLAWFSFFHGNLLLSLFTPDSRVIVTGWEYLKAYSFDVILTSFLFCMIGYFNGLGKTTFTMFQAIIGAFCIRIPFAWFFSNQIPVSLFHIGLSTPMSTFVQNMLCIIYFLYIEKKIKKNQMKF